MRKIKLTPIGVELVDGLKEFRDALAAGVPIEQRFKVRMVKKPRDQKKGGR